MPERVAELKKFAAAHGLQAYAVGIDQLPMGIVDPRNASPRGVEDLVVIVLADGEIRYVGWQGDQVVMGLTEGRCDA